MKEERLAQLRRVLRVVSLERDERRKVEAPRELVCTVCPNSAKLTWHSPPFRVGKIKLNP